MLPDSSLYVGVCLVTKCFRILYYFKTATFSLQITHNVVILFGIEVYQIPLFVKKHFFTIKVKLFLF